MINATRPEGQGSRSHGEHNTAPTLISAVLRYLLFTDSLNKYEGAGKLGDWSLNSTISELANKYCISITRTKEVVGKSRQPVARYSINGPARRHAIDVLTMMDRKTKKVRP